MGVVGPGGDGGGGTLRSARSRPTTGSLGRRPIRRTYVALRQQRRSPLLDTCYYTNRKSEMQGPVVAVMAVAFEQGDGYSPAIPFGMDKLPIAYIDGDVRD